MFQMYMYTLTSCQDVQANILMQSLQFLLSAKAMYFPSVVKSRPIEKFRKVGKTTLKTTIDLPVIVPVNRVWPTVGSKKGTMQSRHNLLSYMHTCILNTELFIKHMFLILF